MPSCKAICLTLLVFPASVLLALAQTVPDPKTPPEQPDIQKDAKKNPESDEKKAPVVAPGGDLKDPTVPSQKLKEIMEAGKIVSSGPMAKLPSITFRGRVMSKDRPPAAILEMDKKYFIVNEGTELTAPGNAKLRVSKVGSQGVEIQGPVGKFWVH